MKDITIINANSIEYMKNYKDEKFDLIFTDPPYLKQFLYTYDWLNEISKKYLKDNGYLITYIGDYYLDEIIKKFNNIKYFSNCVEIYPEKNQLTKIHNKNYLCGHKTILIFNKGEYKNKLFNTVIRSTKKEKKLHEWQQPIDTAIYLIEKFTKENDLVFDPFGGSGTTAHACKILKRKCLTIEIDKKYYKKIIERIPNG